jgi:hypothetical protein
LYFGRRTFLLVSAGVILQTLFVLRPERTIAWMMISGAVALCALALWTRERRF